MEAMCYHFESHKIIKSKELVCEDCIPAGEKWVHLRVCQTCGKTLCCDDSKNRHAYKHFIETGHPVVISAEKGESWAWCYEDEMLIEY
jgi:hypothetical protein